MSATARASIIVRFDDPDASRPYEAAVPGGMEARATLDELIRHAYRVDPRLRAWLEEQGLDEPPDALVHVSAEYGTIDGAPIL